VTTESENGNPKEREAELIQKIRNRVVEVQALVDEMKSRLTDKK